MSTYNMRKRILRHDDTAEKMDVITKLAAERRTLARDKYRVEGVSKARHAVQMAENGWGWPDIARITGVDDSFARLVVLGTD